MIPPEKLAELALLYEEYMYSPDPFAHTVKQAKAVFDAECQWLYNEEPVSFRKQTSLPVYIATVIVVEINKYLDHPQTPYAAI
jgi:hypothetical protein